MTQMRFCKTVIILFTLSGICASAQVRSDTDPGEFSIYLGGGLSSIHHQDAPRNGFFNGYAIDFGVGYTYYFHRNWGIFVGLGPGIYNTRKPVDLDLLTTGLSVATATETLQYELYTQAAYQEAFQITFINLPVMLRYQTQQNTVSWRRTQDSYNGFYAMGGINAGFPLIDTYQSEITTVTNAAYFPELDNWAATQRFAGLGTFDDGIVADGDLALDLSLRLALEAGFKWRLKNNFLLYTGAFCNFGLNNTTQSTREPVRNNIAADRLTDFPFITFSDKIDMLTVGVILRLAFFRKPQNCPFNPYGSVRR